MRLLLQVALLAATGLSLLADQAQFTDVTTPVLANPDYGVGVAWGDFDGDGDLDLAAANGGWAGEAKGSRLFRNDGAGVFADVTPADLASAFAHSVAWADYDNDGDIDLLVGGGGTRLLRNDGRGIFTNVTTGLLQEPSFEATWVDYDSDGYVDIYIVVSGSSLIPAHNRLLRNEGLDVFRNVTTPPLEQPLEATASSWGDYDNDGDLDLSVLNCNCGSAASFSRLFRNDGDGAFADVTAGPLKDTRIALVSVWGDFDNDGNLDLLIGHYEGPTTVLRNDAGGVIDVTPSILAGNGIARGMAWGDYDNDGDLDLLLAKAYEPAQLLRNEGAGAFSDVSPSALATLTMGSAVAWGDFDDDGDLDLFVSQNPGLPKRLLRNELSNANHWLHLDLQGGPSNRSAIGARVTLVAGGRTQIREVSGGSGTYSQDSLTVEFGLGTNTVIESLQIRWPSGTLQTLTGIGVDQHLRVMELGPTDQPPVITFQPVGRSVYVGETVRLSVVAWGTWPLGYQWRKDGTDLPNATNATLVLPNVTLADTGDYTVVVANDFGSVTSAVARLTVNGRPWAYFADFEGTVGQEWSRRQTDVTPVGSRRFLGQFNNDAVNLTLNGLPPHQELTVSLDLFVIYSWDGNDTGGVWPGQAGPDIWGLSVDGGPRLLHTTFLHDRPSQTQAFPEDHPGGTYPGRTGAAENNTLGYVWGDGQVMDSVYHLSFPFPHSAGAVTFSFSAQGLEDPLNESWGLDNVRIELTPPEGVPYIRSELSPVGSVALQGTGPADRVATSGTRALVLAGEAAVALVELKDPAKPVVLGRWEPLFPPAAIALAGNLAYIASYEPDLLSTVEIVDFTNPAKPVLKGYYDTEGYAQDVTVLGSTLYVAGDDAGLAIVDVSNPARPRRIGGYDTHGRVQQVQVSGRRTYLADGDWLLILDVSDPAFPLRVGLYDLTGPVQALRVSGQTAYVLVGTGELRVLDVGDPGNVRLLGTYRTWGVQSLAVAGKYAYLAKGSRGLEVVDVSDPAKPVWVTGLATGGRAEDVAVIGTSVGVAGGDQGVVVYRLEQGIYPPLAPPVIADGMLTLSWPAMEGVRLQRTSDLVPAAWEDVPESEGTNVVRLAVTRSTGFFGLAMGRGFLTPTNLVWVEPGTFVMGSPDDELGRWPWEGPQVTVTITRGFWIGRFEVTQQEYLALIGRNPSRFVGDPRLPVETVTWFEASDYCAALTAREAAAGRLPTDYVYRLPTEAEWEYACRGGTTTRRSYGDDLGDLELADYAWYADSVGGTTHPVGLKQPNPWGLYDMHGNVWEWVQDWWDFSLPGGTAVDPQGPSWHTHKVVKGGSATDAPPRNCRSATRGGLEPDFGGPICGLRVVLAPRLSD